MTVDLDAMKQLILCELPEVLDELRGKRIQLAACELHIRERGVYVEHLESELEASSAKQAAAVAEVVAVADTVDARYQELLARAVQIEVKLQVVATKALALIMFEYERADGTFDLATVRGFKDGQPYKSLLLELDGLDFDRAASESLVQANPYHVKPAPLAPVLDELVTCGSTRLNGAWQCCRQLGHADLHEAVAEGEELRRWSDDQADENIPF